MKIKPITCSIRTGLRPINVDLSGHSSPIFTEVVVDNRALAYRAMVVGKSGTTSEALAEMVIENDALVMLADKLLDSSNLTMALRRILPKDEMKVTEGQTYFTFSMLVEACKSVLKDVVVATVFADILSHALARKRIMLPSEGHMSMLYADELFPGADVILRASAVKQLADVLDSLHLDPGFGQAKTATVGTMVSALAPAMQLAGRQIMQLTLDNQYLSDSMLLAHMFLTNDELFPRALRSNPDLLALAGNLTFALASLEYGATAGRGYDTPDHDLKNALAAANRLMRTTERFTIMSLPESREYFSAQVLREGPTLRSKGIVISRNLSAMYKAQATAFTTIGASDNQLWNQTAMPTIEGRVDAILSGLSGLRTQDLLHTISNVALLAEPRASLPGERESEPDFVVIAPFGTTNREMLHFAAAVSRRVILTGGGALVAEDGSLYLRGSHGIIFENQLPDMPFEPFGLVTDATVGVLSVDPAEAILLAIRDTHIGGKAIESKSQAIPLELRKAVWFTQPDDFTIPLRNEIAIEINVAGGEIVRHSFVPAVLLGYPQKGMPRVALTHMPVITALVNGYLEALLAVGKCASTNQHEKMTSLQIGMAINSLLERVYKGIAAQQTALSLARSFTTKDERARQYYNQRLAQIELLFQTALFWLKAANLVDELMPEVIDALRAANVAQHIVASSATQFENIIDFS